MKQETKNRGLELDSLVMNYQKTGEEKYFEELWKEVKAFAFMKGNKYRNTISAEDMEEMAMVCLYDCCRCLKEGTNVLTYYGRILVNRYHDFYSKPRKRGNDILNNNALSLDYEYGNENSNSAFYNTSCKVEDDIFFIDDFYKECKLAENEIVFVDLLNYGYKQAEIMEKLKMEKAEYKKMLKGIRKKIKKNHSFGTIS